MSAHASDCIFEGQHVGPCHWIVTPEILWDSTPEIAAAYLIRKARPGTVETQIPRVVPSVIADPEYRNELARDARTRLVEDVDRAVAVLLRHDRATEELGS